MNIYNKFKCDIDVIVDALSKDGELPGGLDLAAINIQRGRDHGLPDYNQARVDFGLAPVAVFSDITSDAAMQAELQSLYGSVNDVDVWIGALAEDHLPGAIVGELLTLHR